MFIQRPIPMFILLAGLGVLGSTTTSAADRAGSTATPRIADLAYGYGDHDRDGLYDRDDRRGGHDGRYSDSIIHEQVRRALWRALGQRARYIDVGVRGGLVTLSGQVDFRRDRNYARDVAADVRGVRAVDNRIYVRRTYR